MVHFLPPHVTVQTSRHRLALLPLLGVTSPEQPSVFLVSFPWDFVS